MYKDGVASLQISEHTCCVHTQAAEGDRKRERQGGRVTQQRATPTRTRAADVEEEKNREGRELLQHECIM